MQLPEPIPPPAGLLEWLKWLAIVAPIAFSAYVLVRSKTAAIWKEERDAALAKSERLEGENKTLTAEKATVERELGECRARTDLGALMEQHRAFHVEMLSGLTLVASTSDARNERLVAALEANSALVAELTRTLRERG
jgi:hypothetical protein